MQIRKTIRVIGDTHGVQECTRLIKEDLESNFMMNSSYIHVGDFGIGFKEFYDDVADLIELNDVLKKYNNRLYVVRGNHDNPQYFASNMHKYDELLNHWKKVYSDQEPRSLDSYKIDHAATFFYREMKNIIFMADYSTTEIEGLTVFFLGGATSIDREERIKHSAHNDYKLNLKTAGVYWPEEKVEYKKDILDLLSLYKTLEKVHLVVTHTAPSFVGMITSYKFLNDVSFEVGKDCVKERMIMDNIVGRLSENCKTWIYGHFHKSMTDCVDDRIYKCIGQNEIQEINYIVDVSKLQEFQFSKPF